MMGFGMGFYGLGLLMMLVPLALVGLLVWIAVRGLNQRHETIVQPRDEALQIVRERYARGEISREEFEQLQRDLQATNGKR